MTAKEYLRGIIYADRQITDKQNVICRMELYDDHIMDRETKKIVTEMNKQLRAEIGQVVRKKKEAKELIDQLESIPEQPILTKRYIEGKTFEDISAEIYYSYRWVHRLHGRALQKLDKILKST